MAGILAGLVAQHGRLPPQGRGKPPDELRKGKTIHDAIMLAWLEFFQKNAPASFIAVQCEGYYPMHLQGICTDEKDTIFWCFTAALVKTDNKGKLLKKVPVPNHHGDLCHHDGKIFIKTHVLKSGYTLLGIQTATFANGHFWFGCYGGKLLKADPSLKLVGNTTSIAASASPESRMTCSLSPEDHGCRTRDIQARR